MASQAESEFTQVLTSWDGKLGVFSDCHGSDWDGSKIFSKVALAYFFFFGDIKEILLTFLTRPWKRGIFSHLTPESQSLRSWNLPLRLAKCFIFPVWEHLFACLWQMQFHSYYEMSSLTVWMSSVTHSFFSLFYFPIHLITYPLVHSCLAQSHSLNNYLGRTFIIELYGRSRFRKNKSWCVNNILWGFSEHYFILSLSWEAKGQETWLPLHFVTAGSHG